MIIITDSECEAVPGSGISERVIFPEHRETLQIMYAAMLRLEKVEAENDSLKRDVGHNAIRMLELDKYREDAAELLREIRDGEVNPEDEADNFLRDGTRSELSKARARIAELEAETNTLRKAFDAQLARSFELTAENKSLHEQLRIALEALGKE